MLFRFLIILIFNLTFISNVLFGQCPQATGLFTDNYDFNSSSASILANWDSMDDEEQVDHFMVRYKEIDSLEWLNLLSSENFKTIWPLNFNTTYEWYVVAYCSENQSFPGPPSLIDTFTTPSYVECPKPTNLFVNNIIANESQGFADGNWDSMLGLGVDHFLLQYKLLTQNDYSWTSLSNMDSSITQKTMGNLSLNSFYEWRVRSFCSVNESYYSDWSIRDTFEIGEFVPQSFEPDASIIIDNQICEGLTNLSITLSQTANQPDILSSAIFSSSGSFEIETLQEGDEIGYAYIMAGNGFIENNYSLEVKQIINASKAEIALVNLETGFEDDFFEIENETTGIKIFIVSPSDQNSYTSGNSIDLTFTNLFRNPSPGSLDFFFNINSELGDNIQVEDNYLIECTSVQEKDLNFELYPNPATSFFQINIERTKQLKLYNSLGQIFINDFSDKQYFDISNLNSGLYFLFINYNDKRGVKKLIIR